MFNDGADFLISIHSDLSHAKNITLSFANTEGAAYSTNDIRIYTNRLFYNIIVYRVPPDTLTYGNWTLNIGYTINDVAQTVGPINFIIDPTLAGIGIGKVEVGVDLGGVTPIQTTGTIDMAIDVSGFGLTAVPGAGNVDVDIAVQGQRGSQGSAILDLAIAAVPLGPTVGTVTLDVAVAGSSV